MAFWRTAAAALALLAAAGGASPAGAQELEDFAVKDAGSLADLCSTPETSPLHAEARQHCYGFIAGAAALYAEVAAADEIEPVACPPSEPTSEAVRAMFVRYVEGRPATRAEKAIDGLFRAAAAEWPCPRR